MKLMPVVVIALLLAVLPLATRADAPAAPTAKTCFFVRNHLPCPCGRGREARALAHAAALTAGALRTAAVTTTAAITAPALPRNASQPAKR